jgi:hypothetical protein
MLIPIGIWLHRLLLPNHILFGGDITYYFYPMTSIGMELWRAGHVPLWTHLIQCGFPLLADGQGALLYPLNLLAYLTLSPPVAHNLVVLLQVSLSAVFMYFFVRDLALNRWVAVAAGWVYALAGPVAGNLGFPALNGLVWWPLWFLLAGRIALKASPLLMVFAAISMGAGWLGGFPQTTLYGILGASLYMVFCTWLYQRPEWRLMFVPVLAWGASVAIGIGLGMVQLWPTLEMSVFSTRAGGVDFALASQGSMFPTGFAGFLLPQWSQLFWFGLAGPNVFIGLIALAGALVTMQRGIDKRLIFFWLLAVFGCFLSLGKFNPFYQYLYNLPGIGFLRIPSRFLYLTVFSLAILSAAGLGRIFTVSAGVLREMRRFRMWLAVLMGLVMIGTVAGTIILHFKRDAFIRLAESYAARSLLGQAHRLQDASYYQAKILRTYNAVTGALSPWNPAILQTLFLAALAIIIATACLRHGRIGRWIQPLFIGLIALELCMHAGWMKPVSSMDVLSPPRWMQSLTEKESYRIYEVITQDDINQRRLSHKYLSPDYNLLFGVSHMGVYSALGSRRYFDLLRPLGGVNLAFGYSPTTAEKIADHTRLLDLFGVRWIISREAINISGLQAESSGPPFLYKNDNALPRAFVTAGSKILRDAAAVLKAMHAQTFDPHEAVLLESSTAPEVAPGKFSKARLLEQDDGSISLEAVGPGWLVLTELYYPGWQAVVDGRQVPVYQGNYVFMAVPIAEGNHHVQFRYVPRSFTYGLRITIICTVIVLIILGIGMSKIPAMRAREKTRQLRSNPTNSNGNSSHC